MTVYAYSNVCIKQQHLELCHPVLHINSTVHVLKTMAVPRSSYLFSWELNVL